MEASIVFGVFRSICALHSLDEKNVCEYMIYTKWLAMKPACHIISSFDKVIEISRVAEINAIASVAFAIYILLRKDDDNDYEEDFNPENIAVDSVVKYAISDKYPWWIRIRAFCAAHLVGGRSLELHNYLQSYKDDLTDLLLQAEFEMHGIPRGSNFSIVRQSGDFFVGRIPSVGKITRRGTLIGIWDRG